MKDANGQVVPLPPLLSKHPWVLPLPDCAEAVSESTINTGTITVAIVAASMLIPITLRIIFPSHSLCGKGLILRTNPSGSRTPASSAALIREPAEPPFCYYSAWMADSTN